MSDVTMMDVDPMDIDMILDYDPSLCFAKLVPANQAAKDLLAHSIDYMHKKKDAFHLTFVKTIHDSDNIDATEASSSDLNPMSFIFSFEKDYLPRYPRMGWRAGEGSSNDIHTKQPTVELQLGPPEKGSLNPIDMYFRFNTSSGLFMLCGGNQKQAVEYYQDGEWIRLFHPNSRVFQQRSTKIRIARYEYEFVFTILSEHKDNIQITRNQYIKAFFAKGPPTLTLLPDTGAFGWVSIGFNSTTGEPIAMKELQITEDFHVPEAAREAGIGRSLTGLKGLVPVLDAWYEHEHNILSPCGNFPEKFYLFMPMATGDFHSQDWTVLTFKQRLQLYWTSLVGLYTLHSRGLMHRDISSRNILIMSFDPPEAAISDFGKATDSKTSKNTCLGPPHTLAPEVQDRVDYTNKIDIWAWAYTIAQTMGYRCPGDPLINDSRWRLILHHLDTRATNKPEEKPLISLVKKMMNWIPDQRPTTVGALSSRCWDDRGS